MLLVNNSPSIVATKLVSNRTITIHASQLVWPRSCALLLPSKPLSIIFDGYSTFSWLPYQQVLLILSNNRAHFHAHTTSKCIFPEVLIMLTTLFTITYKFQHCKQLGTNTCKSYNYLSYYTSNHIYSFSSLETHSMYSPIRCFQTYLDIYALHLPLFLSKFISELTVWSPTQLDDLFDVDQEWKLLGEFLQSRHHGNRSTPFCLYLLSNVRRKASINFSFLFNRSLDSLQYLDTEYSYQILEQHIS